jgi:hypothetical protein
VKQDIVAQLRASITQCRALDRSTLLEAAAKEIERLRGRVDELESFIDAETSDDPRQNGWVGWDGRP